MWFLLNCPVRHVASFPRSHHISWYKAFLSSKINVVKKNVKHTCTMILPQFVTSASLNIFIFILWIECWHKQSHCQQHYIKWVHTELPRGYFESHNGHLYRQNGCYVKLFSSTNYLFGLLDEAKGSCHLECRVWVICRGHWRATCGSHFVSSY